MAKIVITLKDKEVSELSLDKEFTTIGRDAQNDIYLKNPSVSREHAKIIKKGKVYYIEDLDSTNGTFVNDSMVGWRSGLNDNDRITIGKYTLIFKETAKGKKGKSEMIMPEFMDATVEVKRKRK